MLTGSMTGESHGVLASNRIRQWPKRRRLQRGIHVGRNDIHHPPAVSVPLADAGNLVQLLHPSGRGSSSVLRHIPLGTRPRRVPAGLSAEEKTMMQHLCLTCAMLGSSECNSCPDGSKYEPAGYREMISRHKQIQAYIFTLEPVEELPEIEQEQT